MDLKIGKKILFTGILKEIIYEDSVTGSNGFIGSYLVNHLYEQGHELVCCDLVTGDLKIPNYVATLTDVELIDQPAMVNNTGAFYTTPYTILENSTQTLPIF